MRSGLFVVSFIFSAFLFSSLALADAVTIRTNGQGAHTAWTNVNCNSGTSEWQCVDENPASTSDYLRATGSQKETFAFSNTNLTNVSINNVRIFYFAMRHTSSSNSCFAAMTRSGGVDYLSGVQMCVSTSWVYRNHTYTTNPATGSAWTVSEVEALEAGMYGLNPNDGGRVAQVYAVVDYTPNDLQPSANPSANPTNGAEPLTVNFTGSFSSGDAPFTFFWDFKDGFNSTQQNPTHTFTTAGVYNVSFKVTDNDGDSDTKFVVINVSSSCVRSNPTVSISPSFQTGQRNTTKTYNTTVTNNDAANCGSSTFNLTSSIPSGWSGSFSSNSLSISPGNSASTNFMLTSSSNATFGNYTFNNTATNSGATSFKGTGSAVYSVIA